MSLSAPPKERIWAPQQVDIFDHITKDRGHLIVEAGAGCAKTSTLTETVWRMGSQKWPLMASLAFNRHIRDEMQPIMPHHFDTYKGKERLVNELVVDTIHAICCKACKATFHNWQWNYVDADGWKYKNIVRKIFDEREIKGKDEKQRWIWHYECIDMVSRCQLSLLDPAEENILALQVHFGKLSTMPIDQMSAVVEQAMQTGLRQANWKITFDDMVWLAGIGKLNLPSFAYVMIDELQDLNPAQQSAVLQLLAMGGMMIGVGDTNQSIYGFAGSSINGIDDFKNHLRVASGKQITSLPLMTCYRCPTEVVKLANNIVPELMASSFAKQGLIDTIDDAETAYEKIGWDQGDMWVCRTTAPLIEQALSLIRQDIPCSVLGRDIGSQLGDILDDLEDTEGYAFTAIANMIDDYQQTQMEKLVEKGASQMTIASMTDRCESLQLVYGRATRQYSISDAEGLKVYIDSLFSSEKKAGAVTLCTIHKAKGLEESRVMILRPDLLPHPKATQPWELKQERNLEYIAITRSKEELYFVGGDYPGL